MTCIEHKNLKCDLLPRKTPFHWSLEHVLEEPKVHSNLLPQADAGISKVWGTYILRFVAMPFLYEVAPWMTLFVLETKNRACWNRDSSDHVRSVTKKTCHTKVSLIYIFFYYCGGSGVKHWLADLKSVIYSRPFTIWCIKIVSKSWLHLNSFLDHRYKIGGSCFLIIYLC